MFPFFLVIHASTGILKQVCLRHLKCEYIKIDFRRYCDTKTEHGLDPYSTPYLKNVC